MQCSDNPKDGRRTWQAFFLIRMLKLLLTVTWCRRKYIKCLRCFSCSPSCKASRDWINGLTNIIKVNKWLGTILIKKKRLNHHDLRKRHEEKRDKYWQRTSKWDVKCYKDMPAERLEKVKSFLMTFLISNVDKIIPLS